MIDTVYVVGAMAAGLLSGAGLAWRRKLHLLAAYQFDQAKAIAVRAEHDRMVYSVREFQINGLLHAIASGYLAIEPQGTVAPLRRGAVAVPIEQLDAALIAGGMRIRLKDGSMLGVPPGHFPGDTPSGNKGAAR